MILIRRSTPILLLALSCFALPSQARAEQAYIEYKVERGDTCIGIARKVYGDGQLCYELINSHNDFDARFRIYPGQILKLPTKKKLEAMRDKREKSSADARVKAKRGDVRARPPKKTSWESAKRGQDLWREWRVDSGERSSAEIRFLKERADLRMRENTLVVIYGAQESKKTTRHASLERGALSSRLDELAGEEVIVETPSAIASSKGGDGLVAVLDGGTTLVSNHTSKSSTVRSKKKGGKAIKLPENHGSKVEKGKDPTPPKPLPAPPKWAEDQITSYSVLGETRASLSWGEVKDAAAWRIELFGTNDELVDVFVVDSKITNLSLEQLPPGSYSVKISTTDSEGFEGKPSKPASIEILPVKAVARTFESKRVTPGTTLDFGRLACRWGGEGEFSSTLLAASAGSKTVECKDGEEVLEPIAIEVVDVAIKAPSRVALGASEPYMLEVVLSEAVEAIAVDLPDGVTLTGEPVSTNRTTWRIPISASREGINAPLSIGLDGVDETLASVWVDTRPREARSVAADVVNEPEPLRRAWRISPTFGWRGLAGAPFSLESRDYDQSWRAGLRASAEIERHILFDLGLELGGVQAQGTSNTTLAPGAYLGLSYLFGEAALQPFVGLGGGVELVTGPVEVVSGFFAGGGLQWKPLDKPFGVRLDLQGHVLGGRHAGPSRTFSQTNLGFTFDL